MELKKIVFLFWQAGVHSLDNQSIFTIKQTAGMNWSLSNSAIGRLRMAGIAEGLSFIIFLFIAMPLKYFAGDPRMVLYIGWVHGLLFMLFILALITVPINLEWRFRKTLLSFLASLLPFGTFVMDKVWQKDEKELIKEKCD